MLVVKIVYQDGEVEYKTVSDLHKFYLANSRVHGMTFSIYPLLVVANRIEADAFLDSYTPDEDEPLTFSQELYYRNRIHQLESEMQVNELHNSTFASLQREVVSLQTRMESICELTK